MSTPTLQAAESSSPKNLNLLSLDAGGPRTISQLVILKNILELISSGSGDDSEAVVKRPYELFHVIGGVGTGGLIAMFLVVLKMTATEALKEFISLVGEVFKDVAADPKKRTEQLKSVVDDILERYGLEKSAELISNSVPLPACKLIVPIMYKRHIGVPCVLRNYIAGHEPPTNLTIAEAMLATCATPPIFNPTNIYKDSSNFEYIGGELGLSNPTRKILAEAHDAFGGDTTMACLLSIGCGHRWKPSSFELDKATWIGFMTRITMDSEKTAQELAAQMKHLTLYHRISAEYGMEAVESDLWMDPVIILAYTTNYINDPEVAESMNGCMGTLLHRDGFTTLEQLRHSGETKVLSPAMPPLTPHYVERKEATRFVESTLFDHHGAIKPGSKIILITGIGGCGKTQLIRKFVEQKGNKFVTVFFIDGSSEVNFQRGLVRCVRSLGTAHSQKSFDDSMLFLSHRINGDRLLVIDNVDDTNVDLAPMLPRWLNGTVVITSRDSSRGELGSSHLELDVMSQDESVKLLVRGSGRAWPPTELDKEATIAVAKELRFHPIALVQAISYMSNTGYSAATYISRLRSYRELLLNDPATNQVIMRYKTAFAAFDASYEILPPRAQKALHLLSFFHWQNVCLELLSFGAENGFLTDNFNYIPRREEFEGARWCLSTIFLPSAQWDALALDSLIASLRSHSLITVVSTGKATLLQMHPLVHEWARLRVPMDVLESFRSAAVRLLCCVTVEDDHSMIQYLYPHVQALSPAWDGLHVNDTLSFSFILQHAGLYHKATRLWKAGYEHLKAQLGGDHLHTIATSANLASTYSRLGRYGEAEELEIEVLQRRKVLLGADHLDTIRASASLASTYFELGRYGEAEELEKEVISQTRDLLGVGHPDTIGASANLAGTYRYLGRYDEAEELEKDVLRRRSESLGLDHPETIRASGNLAATYRYLGRFSEAQELEKDVFRWRNELLGVDHPDTIVASASLACTYRELGRYGEAEELEKEVLRRGRELAGVDHPYTMRAAENLASTYRKLGRYTEAVDLEREALEQRIAILGERHPHTLRVMYSLAQTYEAMQRSPEAIELASRATPILLETLGETHPLYLETSNFLAGLKQEPVVRERRRDRVLAYFSFYPWIFIPLHTIAFLRAGMDKRRQYMVKEDRHKTYLAANPLNSLAPPGQNGALSRLKKEKPKGTGKVKEGDERVKQRRQTVHEVEVMEYNPCNQ